MFDFLKKKDSRLKENARAHFFVSGKVQGVFFRESAKKKADKLGLNGWVKNLKDGRVEGVIEGERDQVEGMLKWVKGGPIFAEVKEFEAKEEAYEGEFNRFEIEYDL